MSGLNMRPLLLCPQDHTSDIPDVRDSANVSGRIRCGDCGEPMQLIVYGIVDREPDIADIRYRAERARGTWWR